MSSKCLDFQPTVISAHARRPTIEQNCSTTTKPVWHYRVLSSRPNQRLGRRGAVWSAPVIGLKTVAAIALHILTNCLAFLVKHKCSYQIEEVWPGCSESLECWALPYCQPWRMQWRLNPPISSLGMLTFGQASLKTHSVQHSQCLLSL